MPTKHGLPTLYEAVPYPGAPRFFVRRYNMSENTITAIDNAGREVTAPRMPEDFGGMAEGELLIWGYSCRSTYEEDWPKELLAFNDRHAFPSVCFSQVEPDGEFGFTPIQQVQPVECWVLESALKDLGNDWIDEKRAVPGDAKRFEQAVDEHFHVVADQYRHATKEEQIQALEDTIVKFADGHHAEEFAGRGYWRFKEDPGSLREAAEQMAQTIFPGSFAPDPVFDDATRDLNEIVLALEDVGGVRATSRWVMGKPDVGFGKMHWRPNGSR